MNPLKLNTLETRTSISKITARSIASTLLLLLGSVVFSQSALAQNISPRPVARLISDPVTDAHYTRPRRVKFEESSAVTPEPVAASSLMLDNASEVERRAFEQTNLARTENGLEPLAWDAELCRLAREHSQQMATLGYFSHASPEGLQLKERANAGGIFHFRVIGENIAYNKGYDDPGGFAVERWMTSSGHRANILYGGFQASAIGSYVSADGSTYLTQVFITR
jgi:uncharacterized protein YkwD